MNRITGDIRVHGKPGQRWYFGWTIVAAAILLTLLTVGMRLGIGPFFLPMVKDLGFSRSLLASVVAVGMLCYGLAMPLAGCLVGRYNTRPVLLLVAAGISPQLPPKGALVLSRRLVS